MMEFAKRYIWPVAVALMAMAANAQEITFQAQVDRNEIAAGEPVKLTIELSNASASSGISTPDFNGMMVLQGPMESSSFSSVNGRVTRSSSKIWYLTAPQPGKYTIGAATVRIGNASLQTDPITITVSKSTAGQGTGAAADQGQKRDPNLFCTITLSKNKAYVGEQIIATYTLFTRYNALQSRDTDMPKLNGFWAEEIDLGATNWEPQLRTVNGLQYRVAVLRKQVLIPLRSGTLTVAPMTLNYLVNAGFFSSGSQVSIKSNAVEVTAMELPPGKPADFMGAVGELRMEVKAPQSQLKANEAIDLSVRFSGRANLKLIDAPKLALPADFDTYDPKVNDQLSVNSNGMSGSREFQYLLIPRHEGHYDLGNLSFSYFDPAAGTYKQLRSQDLVFDVAPPEGGTGGGTASAKVDVQRLGSDIRYIRTGDLNLRPKGSFLFTSPWYAAGLALPPVLLLLFFIWHRKREAFLSDAELQRRHGADRVAKKRLALAETALRSGNADAVNDAIGKALEGYFADRFNLGVAQVTPQEITEKLGPMDNGATAARYIHLINTTQMARFAPVATQPAEELYKEAVALISHVENQLRK